MNRTYCALVFVVGGVLSDGTAVTHADEDERPRCLTRDSQLMVLGDSYINLPFAHAFAAELNEESGHDFRLVAKPGYSMATGGLGLIPCLFEISLFFDRDVHTVLMDGGGNDILLGDVPGECKHAEGPSIPICRFRVVQAVSAFERLIERMAEVGVRDVEYFFYPHVPRSTFLGGEDPNAMIDYARPMVRSVCDRAEQKTEGALRCHFFDLGPVFAGKPESQWFLPFDVHPTHLAAKAMAHALWEDMESNCLGQTAERGCCAP